METTANYSCTLCENTYYSKSALSRHQSEKHLDQPVSTETLGCPMDLDQPATANYSCTLCEKTYHSKSALSRHHSEKHLNQQVSIGSLRCPMDDCQFSFFNFQILRSHLAMDHEQQLQEDNLQFQTMQDFMNWKKEEENKTNCSFIQRTTLVLKTGATRYYYVCHRSRCNNKPVDEDNRVRSIKSNKSCKISVTCPSTITATTTAATVDVNYCSTHIGHTLDIGHIRLSKDVRVEIAEKLSAGVPPKRILDDVRVSIVPGTSLQPVHLIGTQDITNIQKSFKISYPTRLHENDALSVRMWVEKMEAEIDNPVIYFKEQGQEEHGLKKDDFMLIIMSQYQKEVMLEFGGDKLCIDGTHGTNNYGFQLFTVLVIDSFGAGIPVFFCFCNREDAGVFQIYFEKMKENVGLISPKIFMSDDAPAFYNAWKEVMGPVEHQLLCCWHVRRNWSKNLCKITGPEKKADVFAELISLQSQKQELKFHAQLNRFMAKISTDPDTASFAQYMLHNYNRRFEKWAYCYRLRLGINTNMHLEALHKKIKYSYLDGKKVKRMDKSIHSLLLLVKDLYRENCIKNEKSKPTSKILAIKKNHRLAKELNTSPEFLGDDRWSVPNNNGATQYLVQRNMDVNVVCKCNILCDVCGICIHTFSCECTDNTIRHNICVHIHLLCLKSGWSGSRKSIIKQLPNCTADALTTNIISNNPVGNVPVHSDTAQEIKRSCNLIVQLAEKGAYYNNVLAEIKEVVEKLKRSELEDFSSLDAGVGVSAIEPQIRFIPKKRKIISSP